VIIGGAEDREGEAVILRRFRDLCGGENARIAVLGTARASPDEVGDSYTEAFRVIGVHEVVFLALGSRDEANAAETIEILAGVNGIFFTGGNQRRIADLVGGSRVDSWLHQGFARGLVIAGTSAGAAMMSSDMILGRSEATPSTVELGRGLGFLPGAVIDQHLTERGRLGRLLEVVCRLPHHLGLGVDENTALVVEGNQCEVIGAGGVTVIDASEMISTAGHTADAKPSVLVRVLSTGCAFDLASRVEVSVHPTFERTVQAS
jgi:cyanophycinase